MDKFSKNELDVTIRVLQQVSEMYHREHDNEKGSGNRSLKLFLKHQQLMCALGIVSALQPAPESERIQELRQAAEPLIKYLAQKHNPHVTAIVTTTSVELLQGLEHIGDINEFLPD